jgi:hypothetical protein
MLSFLKQKQATAQQVYTIFIRHVSTFNATGKSLWKVGWADWNNVQVIYLPINNYVCLTGLPVF